MGIVYLKNLIVVINFMTLYCLALVDEYWNLSRSCAKRYSAFVLYSAVLP